MIIEPQVGAGGGTNPADDVFLDAKRRRVYVACGAGSVDVFDRPDANTLKLLAKVETRHGARTCFLDADADRLYVAVPKNGEALPACDPAAVRPSRADAASEHATRKRREG